MCLDFSEETSIPAAELRLLQKPEWRWGSYVFVPASWQPPGLRPIQRPSSFATGLEVITFPSVSRRKSVVKSQGLTLAWVTEKHQTPAENKSPISRKLEYFSAAMVNEDFLRNSKYRFFF